jgi:hypothetical protein
MRASLNDYWRTAMTSAAPKSTTERKPPQRERQVAPPRTPAITLYFAVGLRRFPLLQSHEVTTENVVAAVEHAAKLMRQKAEAR